MSLPYVPFYTSDFLGGTSGMTATTKGVYITILCLIYETEGPLPQNWATLARRCGCTLPAFKRAIDALLDDGKIVIADGQIWSEKVEKHITQRCERRTSAKAAVKTRWGKTKENQGADDKSAMRAQCQPEPEPEPDISKDITNVISANSPPEPAGQISEAVIAYNEAAEATGWPKVQRMNPTRSRALKARLAECGGVDGWRVALDKARGSDFLLGKATGSTPACFDWIVNAANFTKIMESNYDNRTGSNPRPRNGGQGSSLVAGFAAVARDIDAQRRGAG
jgi:uncharacterized protein YdaU (DUF1376 family)